MRKILVFVVALIFIVLACLAYIYRSSLLSQIAILNYLPAIKNKNKKLKITVISNNTEFSFKPSSDFPRSDEFFSRVQNLADKDKAIIITITNNPEDADVPFIKQGKYTSGFRFPEKFVVDHFNIYVDPSIQANQGDFQFEVIQNYLAGILYASEYQKYLDDNSHIPNYSDAQDFGFEITKASVISKKYPIILKKAE